MQFSTIDDYARFNVLPVCDTHEIASLYIPVTWLAFTVFCVARSLTFDR